jgi:hypothetical protein
VTRKLCRGRGWRPNTETKQNSQEYTGQSQRSHGFSFQSYVRYAELRQRGHIVYTTDAKMEDEPPTQLMLQLLTAYAKSTLVFLELHAFPFAHLELHDVTHPPCLGVTRGDHVLWPTMENMISTMMMIKMSIYGSPNIPHHSPLQL